MPTKKQTKKAPKKTRVRVSSSKLLSGVTVKISHQVPTVQYGYVNYEVNCTADKMEVVAKELKNIIAKLYEPYDPLAEASAAIAEGNKQAATASTTEAEEQEDVKYEEIEADAKPSTGKAF